MFKKIIAFIVLVVIMLFACQQKTKVTVESVKFTNTGAEISFTREVEVSTINLYNLENRQIAEVIVDSKSSKCIKLFFNWKTGEDYRVNIRLKNGEELVEWNRAPQKRCGVEFDFQVPYGIRVEESTVVRGSKTSCGIFLENFDIEKRLIQVRIDVPKQFRVLSFPSNYFSVLEDEKGYSIAGEINLICQYDNFSGVIDLLIPQDIKEGVYPIYAEAKVGDEVFKKTSRVKITSVEQVQRFISIVEVKLPTDSEGEFDERKREGTLSIGGDSFLKRILKGKQTEIDYQEHPLAYHTAILKNEMREDAILLITSEVVDPETGNQIEGFRLPPNKSPTGKAYTVIAAKGETLSSVVLPIYVRLEKILEGNYLLRTTIKLFGTDKIISTFDEKIFLITKNRLPGIITFLSFVITVLAFGYFILRHKVIFSRFKTNWIVLASLFGSATFATVNVPGTILWEFLHAILGPFSFIITGFFYGIILYTLLISLVTLVPKVGMVSLVLLVRFFLSGIIFGHFSPVSLLWNTVLAIFLEASLFLSGITRGTFEHKFHQSKRIFIIAGFACGMADSLSSYFNFQIIIFLYRLYYAHWYILMYCLISGFLYTFIGAVLGTKLGLKLRTIAD